MSIVNKPLWWAKLANHYSFSNDSATTIDSAQILSTIDAEVEGQFGTMTSSSFQALMSSVLKPSSGSQATSSIFISKNNVGELVLAYGGVDYLGGTTQDNILLGGLGNDYFGASAGIDLVIGSDETQGIHEKDTIAYLMATSGIYVNATIDTSSTAPNLFANQDVYSFTYADYLDTTFPRIFGFQTGVGGDKIDVSTLLAAVGYSGSNPVGDGYVRLAQSGSDLKISFDADGNGSGSSRELIRLLGTSINNFSIANNLVTTPLSTVTGSPNYLTYVSNDGQGAYDILYSVENIIGSRFNDTIHGHTVLNNILVGAAGDDALFGEGGADTLIGGTGHDTIDGGTGNDLIILGQGSDDVNGGSGIDTFKFDGSIGTDIDTNTATIWDFQAGFDGDKIDVSEILLAAGYAGSNAVADGYVQIIQSGFDTAINIDIDGAGAQAAQTMAILKNTDAGQFSTLNNLVTSTPKILYVGILGQSNGEGLRVLGDDNESGITRINTGLLAQTDYNKISVEYRDESAGAVYVPAMGSTRVNGDNGGNLADSWWFLSTGKPGEILIRAIEMLTIQIAEARASGAVKPVIVWSQGEADCAFIGSQATEEARLAAQTVYKNATLAVFDYIKAQVGDDIQFYIMETGRYIVQASINSGNSQSSINNTVNGLPYIQQAQEQLALARPDIFLATKYTDLPMNYDLDPVNGQTDYWHFHPETREIIGDRIADFIALSLGQDHVLDNPGDYPLYLLSDLTLKSHAGMTISGNANNNIVVGTLGDDILTGGAGNDGLYGGTGFDQVLYQGNYANYTLTLQQNGWINVTDNVFFDGSDTLIDIEHLIFADGYYENGVFISTVQNRNPIAKDDVFQADQDSIITGNLLADNGNGPDTDLDFDPLHVASGTFATTHGSVTIQTNGNFTYTPNAGYVGVDTFNYTLEDGRGGSAVGNVSVTLVVPTPNNDPVAMNDIFVGTQDVDVVGNLLVDNGNGPDSDIDSDPLNVVAGTFATAHGSVTIASNGGFVYTPNTGYFGTDSFTYTLQDGRGASDVGQANITIDVYVPPVNVNPVAQDDGFTAAQDTNIIGNLLVNNGNGVDTDSDGGTLSVIPQSFATAHGYVVILDNGNFTYTPIPGYSGSDTFNYTLLDGQGGSDVGSVTLNLTAANVILGTTGNDNLGGTANDDVMQALAGNDTVKGRDGNDIMYGGDGNDYLEGNNGNDILYGGLGVDTMKGSAGVDTYAYLSILEAGDIIQDFGATVGEKIDLTSVLVNAAGFKMEEAFSHGYLRAQQSGPNTLLYIDMDGSAGSGAEVLLATLQGVQVTNISLSSFILPASGIQPNEPPVAKDDAFTGDQDMVIMGNVLSDNGYGADTDADGNPLTVVAGTYATAHGTVTVSTFGTFSYTPNSGYFGNDTFDYTVEDGEGGSDVGTVHITINQVIPNTPPVALDDVFVGEQDMQITGSLLADNGHGVDTDVNGDTLSVVAGTFITSNGSVTINADGTFAYTPDTGYFGSDVFDYTLEDGFGGSDVGTVNLTINQFIPNTPPAAQDDIFVGEQDIAISGNVLADNGNGADSDFDNDSLTVIAGVFATANGTVTINADGTFLYTPNAGYFGNDVFDYTLEDGEGGSDTGTVNLTINQFINIPPVAQDDVFVGEQDMPISGNLLADNGNGMDADGNAHSLSVVAGVFATANGTVTINADGTFTYTPNSGYFGSDVFDYTVEDGYGGSDIGTVNLAINQFINVPPVAQDDVFSGTQDNTIFGNLLVDNGNGVDSDGNNHTLSVVAGVFGTSNGSVTINADGTFAYTPNSGYFGSDAFDYTVEDGHGGTDVGTVNLAINAKPIAKDDVFSGDQDLILAGNVLADNGQGVDADPDSNPLSVVAGIFATTHGSVTMAADGSFTYTPNSGFFGIDIFDYTLQDSYGASDTGTIFLTINHVNHAPVAQEDMFVGTENTPITGNVLADNGQGADTDPDGDTLNLVAGVFATTHGSVTIAADGAFIYTSNTNYFGIDSFNYVLEDGQGGSDVGTVNLTVNALNNQPVAQDDMFTGLENGIITGNLLADNGNGVDFDPDGHSLTPVSGIYATTNGSVNIAANGTFAYTPNMFYYGTDSFSYTLQDGHGGSDIGSVNLTITSIEIVGTSANNSLAGTAGNDVIRGLGGNDTLSGELGDDIMFGDDGNDTLKGRDGNDTMYGGDGVDYLEGGNGNDILYGGLGIDTLKGSTGSDTFAFLSVLEAGDTIQDFSRTNGDKIDISNLLDLYDSDIHAITDFVQIATSGSNSVLSVDVDGGGDGFVTVATLLGIVGLTDEQGLVDSGQLIV